MNRQDNARELRESGMRDSEIARRLGVAQSTVRRWLNPGERERDLATARLYKAEHRERLRAYGRDYHREHRARCVECDGLMGVGNKTGGVCLACRSAVKELNWRAIQLAWEDGLSMPEICDLLGWSHGHLGNQMARMRQAGWALPHRYQLARVA